MKDLNKLEKGKKVKIKIGRNSVVGNIIAVYKDFMTVRVEGYSVQTVHFEDYFELIE